ncbi:MAG: EAL domain-containing protein [Gammaproteobacteria bacterium]|nr:EAL domain-containing protein [Gammaproteobacteria bacterium]
MPQRNEIGVNAQRIDQGLATIRHSVIELKQDAKDANSLNTKVDDDILKLKSQSVVTDIKLLKEITGYELLRNKDFDKLESVYNDWLKVDRQFYALLSQGADSQQTNIRDQSLAVIKRDNLFREMMVLLAGYEDIVHKAIADGHFAARVLQFSGFAVISYLFVLFILYQYFSNLKHRSRENNLAITLQSIGDAVISIDKNGDVLGMNLEAERLTDWLEKEAEGHHLSEVVKLTNIRGDEINDFSGWMKKDQDNNVASTRYSLNSRYGEHYEISGKYSLIKDSTDSIKGVVFVFKDITDSVEMQRDIEAYSSHLRHIVDHSIDAVIVMDETGEVREWSLAAEVMFGWSFSEIVERSLDETIIPHEYRQRHTEGIQRLMNSEDTEVKTKRIETLALHKNGDEFPIELSMKSVHTDAGWIFYAYIRDLTNDAKKDKEILKNEALLLAAQHTAKLGCWEYNHVTKTLEWSDETYRIFGYDTEKHQPTFESFLNAIHEDDVERVKTEFAKSIADREDYDVMHRIVLEDGTKKIVHEQCTTSFDNDGAPLSSLGVVQDITERVSTLDNLRLAETAFDTHAGILITNEKGAIIRVNPAIEKMTGYTAEELIGENPRIFQSGIQDEKFYEDMWYLISESGIWQGEVWNKRKDGELYAEWLTITSVRDEYGEVVRYVATSQDITKRKEAEAHVEHLAYHDDLTGLANRRLLLDRLEQNISSCARRKHIGALLLLDLDRFKDLNDSLGHPVGDELLRQVANRLTTLMREEDTVARLGGDEFVILLPDNGNDEVRAGYEAQKVAEKIRLCLSDGYTLYANKCYINVSIGITLFDENTKNIDDVLKQADSALYNAKAKGRNAVSFYESAMQADVDRRLSISEGLREAIKNNEFILHYQPQLDVNHKLVGAEVLVRWLHPEKGMIPPGDFIPIAEETGLIIEVGDWVLREAARQIGLWHKMNVCKIEMLRLAINVSPQQFHQENFVEHVLDILLRAEVSPDCIELEITESLLMQNRDEVIEKIKRLRENHIRVSIDDFGTGYSSLAYLKQLPLDKLKIDQSFVRDIVEDDNDAMIVETIISMASHLGLEVIAEGVETKEQLMFLTEKGCQNFQGYYFSQPLDCVAFESYIENVK